MQTVNIGKAKAHLSRLVAQAVKGEPFVIAKAGKPLVKVMALEPTAAGRIQRLGFLPGGISIPSDFDAMGSQEIERLFGCEGPVRRV